MAKKIQVTNPEINQFIDEFLLLPSESMVKTITGGTLEDGRAYQIQLLITTDESEFINE